MESESDVHSKFLLNRFHLRSLESLLPLGGTCSSNPFYAVKGFCGRTVFCEKKFITLYFSQKRKNCGRIACFRRKTFLCLCTVLLYRLTGKLINYYRKPSKLRIVQWRATPSGSFREPVDYKGQEPSNLVFSEFRRSLLCSKTFFVYNARQCGLTCNLWWATQKV